MTTDLYPETTPDPGTGSHNERRWLILLVVLVAQVMILIDATVIQVALPSAQADLHFSTANREWVVTAYTLAFGSLLPLGGRLADLLGRKRMFLIGLVGFALFSALAGAAQDTAVLFVARTLQGAFAAVLAPTVVSTIAVTFTDLTERNKAFAVFGAVAGSAGALGFLLGGVLTSYVNWRWTMYVNVLFAVVAIIGGLKLMTNSADPRRPKLDIPGAVLSVSALFLLVFGGAKAETDGWGSTITIASLVAGVILLGLFVFAERRASYPLVPIRVFFNRNRGGSYSALLLANAAIFSCFLFLTYYFQQVLGYSPVKTGIAFLPFPLAISVAATLVQTKLLPHFTTRTIMLVGLTISAGGAALLTQAGVHSDYPAWVLPGLILMGAGIGSGLVVAVAMGSVPDAPEEAGAAGGMNNVSQQVGSALGVAFVSTIVATATSNYLGSHPSSSTQALIAHASVHGFSVGFAWAAGIYFVAAVLSSRLVMGKKILSATASEIEAVEEDALLV